ncbi:MAG: hypothetical protein UY61_C0061G0002 [Candidatus Adlerbacteria bacterium GW2011_GWC1_50_9]|uniref:Uncharacterized protein n=1 Tax=Candidatus Adlerbacteria bacterium GW2011_GWC1_50_9 TaxID=1618608 RepID=A0A0G1ZIR4_9BACT|nr:MAG: hypothetical protein UY61_C0061G0002 [Candidatus Adlerbacteria bacterium GW2011_GWC1_50_9]
MNRGFSNVWVIVGLIVVFGGVVAWWAFSQNSSIPTTSDTTELSTTPLLTGATVNSKTYRSKDWGIEFEYPSRFVLNTSPSAFWKNFGPYREGYDFFELVDSQRNCYIGPVKATGIYSEGITTSNKSVATASAKSLEIKYWTRSDGTIFLGQAGLITPSEGYQLTLNIVSLSNDLIESPHEKSTPGGSVLDTFCIKDFETILTTLEFTK